MFKKMCEVVLRETLLDKEVKEKKLEVYIKGYKKHDFKLQNEILISGELVKEEFVVDEINVFNKKEDVTIVLKGLIKYNNHWDDELNYEEITIDSSYVSERDYNELLDSIVAVTKPNNVVDYFTKKTYRETDKILTFKGGSIEFSFYDNSKEEFKKLAKSLKEENFDFMNYISSYSQGNDINTVWLKPFDFYYMMSILEDSPYKLEVNKKYTLENKENNENENY